jgi:hypothetical protein
MERDNLENLSADGRIILKSHPRNYVNMKIGLNWLSTKNERVVL